MAERLEPPGPVGQRNWASEYTDDPTETKGGETDEDRSWRKRGPLDSSVRLSIHPFIRSVVTNPGVFRLARDGIG